MREASLSGPDPIRVVDPAPVVALAAATADFPLQAPAGLAEGWRPTSARWESTVESGAVPVLHIGYVTPEDQYAQVTQSTVDDPSYLKEQTSSGRPVGTTSTVDGRSWDRWEGDKRRSLVRIGQVWAGPADDLARLVSAYVLAIKQTIYRTGSESELMDLLLEAVRRGKEVLAVVELKARFDEEANINWAERLEKAGAHVVYGVVGYKTHAKMMLIVRREESGLRHYAHLGTGNYHPRTARMYTDYGLLTADTAICKDMHNVFLQLTSLGKLGKLGTTSGVATAAHPKALLFGSDIGKALLFNGKMLLFLWVENSGF